MYSHKASPAGSPALPRAVPVTPRDPGSVAHQPRSTADEWSEESNRQSAALASKDSPSSEAGIFTEFRRKLAMGEALSRAFARLAEALRFSGRITVWFHQGRITKTVFEELHIRTPKTTGIVP